MAGTRRAASSTASCWPGWAWAADRSSCVTGWQRECEPLLPRENPTPLLSLIHRQLLLVVRGRNVAARAIWKGVISMPGVSVPVKVFSARNDRSVHFRLLHETDKVPVKQELVDPETDEVVPYDEVQREIGRAHV